MKTSDSIINKELTTTKTNTIYSIIIKTINNLIIKI
jgi:hypothetical protein